MPDEQKSWTEATARRWLGNAPWWPDVWTLNIRLTKPSWYEPEALPEPYEGARSREEECMKDALTLREEHPELAFAIGFAFREEEGERGILHCATIDAHGHVVDPATARLGLPVGYLLARLPEPVIRALAARNGIAV